MSADEPLRRLLPAPRHRPGPLSIAVRWRGELALVAAVVAGVQLIGPPVAAAIGGTLALLVALVPTVRRVAVGGLLRLVVPHRVRAGLVQAGVTDRSGRPPWLVRTRYRSDVVAVHVWLRSGTTVEDLGRAAPVLRAACGAAQVEVVRNSPRHDRAAVVVTEPRWGWPG